MLKTESNNCLMARYVTADGEATSKIFQTLFVALKPTVSAYISAVANQNSTRPACFMR
jgi:hypothetical protein